MSDEVAIELIKTSGMAVSGVCSLIGLIFTVKMRKSVRKTGTDIKAIKEQTNGMQAQLLEHRESAAKQVGFIEGKIVANIERDNGIELTDFMP